MSITIFLINKGSINGIVHFALHKNQVINKSMLMAVFTVAVSYNNLFFWPILVH